MAAQAEFEDLGLSILGLGTQYPPHSLKPSSLEELSKRFYPESPAYVFPYAQSLGLRILTLSPA
jgi:hypothetical protein